MGPLLGLFMAGSAVDYALGYRAAAAQRERVEALRAALAVARRQQVEASAAAVAAADAGTAAEGEANTAAWGEADAASRREADASKEGGGVSEGRGDVGGWKGGEWGGGR